MDLSILTKYAIKIGNQKLFPILKRFVINNHQRLKFSSLFLPLRGSARNYTAAVIPIAFHDPLRFEIFIKGSRRLRQPQRFARKPATFQYAILTLAAAGRGLNRRIRNFKTRSKTSIPVTGGPVQSCAKFVIISSFNETSLQLPQIIRNPVVHETHVCQHGISRDSCATHRIPPIV